MLGLLFLLLNLLIIISYFGLENSTYKSYRSPPYGGGAGGGASILLSAPPHLSTTYM